MDVIYRYDPFAPIVARQIPDADAAISELVQGNDRFKSIVDRMQQHTLGESTGEPMILPMSPMTWGLPLFPGAVPTQAPFAAVLGCSDARVPTEAVFDQTFNNLFVLRIAGNVLGSECLGSLHYALRNLKESLKLVVVLGHAKCGAVTAAVDTNLSPDAYANIACTFPLRSLVDQIQIAVRGATHALETYLGSPITDKAAFRSTLVAVTSYVNAAVSALELQRELDLYDKEGPRVVFGVYEFESLRVQSSPEFRPEEPRLRSAPRNAKELADYAFEVVTEVMSLDNRDLESGSLMASQS
ncbi:carbonic anhydrase [Schlesneria sp. T3-172]|uniref:carbonic anhydrase n=1 Tax=Schlesneria sphaerica TaxID=3373610 RepID=UPI0037CC8510